MITLESLTRYKEPELLYHGSAYKQDELKPGYYHTKEVVNWDKYESNIYLYSTADKKAAEMLGIASSWEKSFELTKTQFNEDAKMITLTFDGVPPSREELLDVKVYIYTIKNVPGIWIKNNNPYNNIGDEYKTTKTVTDIYSCDPIDIREILKDYQITIN